MHLADTLARRRRHTARLIASDHEQPRFFGLAGGRVADPCFFSGARDRFAARFFARGFKTTFCFGLTRGGVLAGLFAGRLTGGLKTSLLFSFTRGGLLARLFTRGLASNLNATFLFGCLGSRFAARFFAGRLTRSFHAAFFFGGTVSSFATRFLARSLPGSLANSVKAARFLGVAGRSAAPYVASRLIAPAFALAHFVATPLTARTIAIPLAARKAVTIAPLRFAVPRLALPRTLIAVIALLFAVRTTFVFYIVSWFVFSRTDIAFAASGRWLGRRCGDRTPVGAFIAAALFDHPIEPLIDGQIDAPRLVALSFARLRADASQIPRTARFHPRAQTTSEGAVCAPPSGRRW